MNTVGPGGSINFPKLSPSPTHPARTHHLPAIPAGGRLRPQLPRQPQALPENDEEDNDYMPAPRAEPLSFEQALAMGRGGMGGGGRQLPSPMPNGFKPSQGALPQDSSIAPSDRRLGGRRAVRSGSNRAHQTGDERNSDSDEDDWC